MKRPGRLLTALLLLMAQATYCVRADDEDDDFRTTFFDDKGRPTDAAVRYFQQTLPDLKIVHGVDIPVASQNQKGEWSLLDEAACITLSFRVSASGTVDKFIVLDSQPKDILVPAVTQAVSQWKFEKLSAPAWFVLPFRFGWPKPRKLTMQRGSKDELDDLPECVAPKIDIQSVFSAGVESADKADHVYPTADLLRAHPAGCATLAFRIGADGVPADLELLDAKPDQSYVDVAALQVEAWRFKPFALAQGESPRRGFAQFSYTARQAGIPVPQCMTADFAAQHYQSSEHPQ